MTNETKQKDKNEFSGYTQKEILAVVDSLYGVKKIHAYVAAGKPDLAYNSANEELRTARVSERYSLPEAMPPYTADNWPILLQKKKFDEQGIAYDSAVAIEKLKNTQLWTTETPLHPTIAELKTIDDLLETNGLNDAERKDFLANSREKAKKEVESDKICHFFYHGKETAYSSLAKYTGVPRKDVALHYLDSLFEKILSNNLSLPNELPQDIEKFIKKENIAVNELVPRLENVMQAYTAKSSGEKEKAVSQSYWLARYVSNVPGVEFPKKLAASILKEYVNNGNSLYEWSYRNDGKGDVPSFIKGMEKDNDILPLREKSMKLEMAVHCEVGITEYAIREFNLDPKEGWLGTTLKNHLNKWKKSDDADNLESAVSIGRKYALLSKEEIEKLERKYKLIKLLKSD